MDCFNIEKGTSLVRVFHAAPSAPAVDVYVDDTLVFSGIEFMDFTDYVSLEEGEYLVEVYPTGTKDTPAISEVLDIEEGEMFTVAATQNEEELFLLVIKDHASKKASPKYSTFRVIHLSPDAPNVDILVDDDVLFEDIEFTEGTMYVDVKPGKYNVKVAVNETGDVALQLKINLKPDRIYTIYAVGEVANLSAIQSVDGNTYLCK